MDENRLADLSRWRDAQLVARYGDESAAFRLREFGVAQALEIDAPTADELLWTDVKGDPVDPDHTWWGYNGMSAVERKGRSQGKWPPG
ncbi:hypothetical protein [Aurantimonas marina]|uniref:hypothetical protein n=1 Tax=Aurantimonas marina TaxID=2780508 RepID=UPI0019D23CDF|nr:hypothetical protein [Aurantimonas marina]